MANIVQKVHQYGDTTDTIHEGMVQLDHERGTFAIHSLNK